ncbi:sigma-70 family RNA polymerase sigma factor [Lentibacillus sp. CBA3610]|uniref:sigma-70 family RNA polymerase sigma factor n=1 Tax=Lentibacillus sp. CBA3610 TaxID=2518176 RepID=UPI0015961377|nr:sigma-70 family RNA polymerase sigma factor [Lentibacillus sp. CBA3610]QKY68718.1 sigma-70 family RNA polymerase sigma factor [Lentibacillus sp. CBA3610]
MEKKLTFEEIFEQNELRIHYQIHKMHIHDPHQEFFQEGLVALWNAYETYQPDKGPMATYFNYMIRNRLIDRMRRNNRQHEIQQQAAHEQRTQLTDGNYHCSADGPRSIAANQSLPLNDAGFWKHIQPQLTDKQWKWVDYAIIQEMPYKTIAQQENTTVEAVKSWGRQVKKKLKKPYFRELLSFEGYDV